MRTTLRMKSLIDNSTIDGPTGVNSSEILVIAI